MTIMLPGPSFRSTFVFSINSLMLPGFPLASFHLAEALLSAFLWLYTLVCAVAQKILRNVFYSYSHFQYSFCNQPVLFAQLENVNKLQNNNRNVPVNKIQSCQIILIYSRETSTRYSLTLIWYSVSGFYRSGFGVPVFRFPLFHRSWFYYMPFLHDVNKISH